MFRRIALALAVLASLSACGPGTGEVLTPEQTAPTSADVIGDPAHGAEYALDVSFWEGPISEYEMDCFWSAGVRHLVVGTQLQETTSEQLRMAVARGMTVDAYVFLYWDQDPVAQVNRAFQMVQGFPVGRMWLDVEAVPKNLGANQVADLLQQAVDACRSQGDCGIYSGPGFWKSYMNDTTRFSDLPLWYALYNGKTSLGDWSTEHFGGWSAPVAKQFTSVGICGIGGADGDVMQVSAAPQVVVDRTPAPAPTAAPSVPADLFPTDGSVVTLDYLKMMVDTVPGATQYQFALEAWSGTAFGPYYTWSPSKPFVRVTPYWPNKVYRFRSRAKNAFGWGAWSDYAAFGYGSGAPAIPTSGTTPPPPPPSTSTGSTTPANLSPDGNATMSSASVTLSCDPVSGASRYTFAIEVLSGSAWVSYYSYAPSGPAQTFYPQIHGQYRWRVQATVSGVAGPWSSYATFDHP